MTAVLTAYLLFGVLHILLMAFWSWVFRAGITEIAFGFGPKLFSVGIVSCKLLPVGGSVSLLEQAPEAGERLERQSYVDLALWKKLAIAVAPILTLLTLCSGVLGAAAWSNFAAGFGQFALGAISPLDSAQGLLSRLTELALSQPWLLFFALFWTKLCMVNALPQMGQNGGTLLAELLRGIGLPESTLQRTMLATWLVLLPCFVSWWFAVALFVWRTSNG